MRESGTDLGLGLGLGLGLEVKVYLFAVKIFFLSLFACRVKSD